MGSYEWWSCEVGKQNEMSAYKMRMGLNWQSIYILDWQLTLLLMLDSGHLCVAGDLELCPLWHIICVGTVTHIEASLPASQWADQFWNNSAVENWVITYYLRKCEHSIWTLCKRTDIIVPKLLSIYQPICRVHPIITEIIMRANKCICI